MGTVHWDDHGVATLVQARTNSATLPVVLCAPHGGNGVDGDQQETLLERSIVGSSANGVGVDDTGERRRTEATVSLVADVGTSQLLEEIDRSLTRRCRSSGEEGRWAAAVVARFHRKYVDANRELDAKGAIAVHPSCERAREAHTCYHRAIEGALRVLGSRSRLEHSGATSGGGHPKAGERGGRLLLLDVHGQRKFAKNILIGTCNGKTADLEALNAPGKGFLWHLRRTVEAAKDQGVETGTAREGVGANPGHDHQGKEAGPAVVLPLRGDEEIPGYTGGYTVRRHGLLAGGRETPEDTSRAAGEVGMDSESAVEIFVDAVQLEFGSQFRRTSEARAAAAEAVAEAIFHHLQHNVWFRHA